MNADYVRTVQLLLGVAPAIFDTPAFAMRGGTALNLFLQEMPRLAMATRSGRSHWGWWRALAGNAMTTGVPGEVGFAAKTPIALAQLRALLDQGAPHHCVLADAGHGADAVFRQAWGARAGYPVSPVPAGNEPLAWGLRRPAAAPQGASRSMPGRASASSRRLVNSRGRPLSGSVKPTDRASSCKGAR